MSPRVAPAQSRVHDGEDAHGLDLLGRPQSGLHRFRGGSQRRLLTAVPADRPGRRRYVVATTLRKMG